MGNQQTQNKIEYQNHVSLGVLLWANKDIMAISIDIKEGRYLRWKSLLQFASKFSHLSHFLIPLDYHYKNVGLCSTIGTLQVPKNNQISFYHYSRCLKNIINQRKLQLDYLTEEQIWYILLFCLQAGINFQKYRMVYEFSSKNVLINHDNNFKIVSQVSFPQNLEQNQSSKNKINKLTISLALFILQLATLRDSSDLVQDGQIKEKQISLRLKTIKSKYSVFLIRVIKTLLQTQIKIAQIKSILAPYKSHINSFCPFKPIKQVSKLSLLNYQKTRSQQQLLTIKQIQNESCLSNEQKIFQ